LIFIIRKTFTEFLRRTDQSAQAQVDGSSLALFRIMFGAILLGEVFYYWTTGIIDRQYIEPTFHFTYLGFNWVQAWPGIGMYFHFIVLAGLACLIMLGILYRLSSCLFCFAFTYLFLVDEAFYLNHFYFAVLISVLLIVVPANNAFSLDVLHNKFRRHGTVPLWSIWLLRFQVGVVYFYGGIAKINEDWLAGEPMRTWISSGIQVPVLGQWFGHDWMMYFFSYSGLLIDLFAVPLLLCPRFRIFGLTIIILFHLMNSQLFVIGLFPWLMIAGSLLFLSPNWPTRSVRFVSELISVKNILNRKRSAKLTGQMLITDVSSPSKMPYKRVWLVVLGIFISLQILLPFRHFLYDNKAIWTESGSRFAWRMMLRDKTGFARFTVVNPENNQSWEIRASSVLTAQQEQVMLRWPDMINQFGRYVADDLREKGYGQIQVKSDLALSLNGRPLQLFVDPEIDLSSQKFTLDTPGWILPLDSQDSGRYAVPKSTFMPASYERFIALTPDLPNAYVERAREYQNLELYDLALQEYNRAIRRNEQYSTAYNDRGTLFQFLEENQLALEDYNKAIEIDSKYAGAYNNRATIHQILGESQLALEDYSKAIELNSYWDAYANRAGLYYQLQKYDLSKKDLDDMVRLNPTIANIFYKRGMVNSRLGLVEESRSDLGEACRLDRQYC